MHLGVPKRMVQLLAAALLASTTVSVTSCKDDYIYDDHEPDYLGASIYEYLQQQGNFTNMLRLIDDLGYRETLVKTGSKTLFPANDAAFERFYQSNPYGAHSYEELTVSQKRIIMNASMINMAYLSDMLPNTSNPDNSDNGGKGQALRRGTSSTNMDSVQAIPGTTLPETIFWERFKDDKVFLTAQAPMMVHFTPQMMNAKGITSNDFNLFFGQPYNGSDIFVNNVRVVHPDIICKNGYIHEMEEVALPSETMAEAIGRLDNTTIFNKLLDKFSAPYYDGGIDASVKEYYNGSTALRPVIPGLSANDSVFVKRYFNEQTASTGPKGEGLSSYGMLYYDPNNTTFGGNSDMGVMFVPTDAAMMEYFNGSEGGYLRDSYGDWDNVPTDLLATFLKNHQKRSFMASLPHLWPTLTDETSYAIKLNEGNVVNTVLTSNGVVFVIDKVIPPIDYKATYASTLTSEHTKVMKWALTDNWNNLGDENAMYFFMYLRSMENMYNLIVPTDEALLNYREPISWQLGGAARRIWEFYYDADKNAVYADIYYVDENGEKGEMERKMTDQNIVRNRLTDIIDMNIVIGTNDGTTLGGYINDSNANYFLTKGGATIYATGKGTDVVFNGGGDMEMGLEPAHVVYTETGHPCLYDSQNGRTFFIDHILHDPVKNVYEVLGEHEEFSRFFELCMGDEQVSTNFIDDKDFVDIFGTKYSKEAKICGIGHVVNNFNNYRYTILVPTNEALDAAFAADSDLWTWEEIAAEEDMAVKKEKALYLLSFLRYHFVDNSAYISGAAYGPMVYESGSRNEYDRFRRLTISSNGHDLTVNDETGHTAKVLTSTGCYNYMARDIIGNAEDPQDATRIFASSRAVIHLIDRALTPKK